MAATRWAPGRVASFAEFLREKGIVGLDECANLVEKAVEATRPYQVPAFILRGPPGTGKTTIAELYAEYACAEKYFFQCTAGVDESDFLYNIVPDESSRSGFRLVEGVLVRALRVSREKKVVLIVDEFDKSRPRADAFFLNLLQHARVTVNTGNGDTVVEGNRDNLVVFFTSNDAREFSEPFLRRVVVLQLESIPPLKVLEILSREFDEKVAVVLTQVYDDTIKAGLQKPATVNELRVAGRLIEAGVDLDTVVRSVIVKYPEDLQRFFSYIASRKPYEFLSKAKRKEDDSIVERYEGGVPTLEVKEERREEKRKVLPERVPSITIRQAPSLTKEPEDVTKKRVEVFGKFANNYDSAYTAIIQGLQPEPTDDPTVIGKFKLLKDFDEEFVVATAPLKLHEVAKLPDGEVFVDDTAIVLKNSVDKMLSETFEKIRYYTRDTVLAERGSAKVLIKVLDRRSFAGHTALKVEIKISGKTKDVDAVVKRIMKCSLETLQPGYTYKTDRDEEAVGVILALLFDNVEFEVTVDRTCGYNYVISRHGKKCTVVVGYKRALELAQTGATVNDMHQLGKLLGGEP